MENTPTPSPQPEPEGAPADAVNEAGTGDRPPKRRGRGPRRGGGSRTAPHDSTAAEIGESNSQPAVFSDGIFDAEAAFGNGEMASNFEATDREAFAAPSAVQTQKDRKRRGPGARSGANKNFKHNPQKHNQNNLYNLENSAAGTLNPEGDSPAAALDPRDDVIDADKPQRLHKALAQTGLGSRRKMEALIADGQVQINGVTAEIGQSVQPGDRVHVKRRKVNVKLTDDKPQVLIYHKEAGEIVSRDDPENRPTVFQKIKAPDHGKWVAVGRLDFNSEGLLLFTTYGELANRLMHPRYQVMREYSVRILGELTPEQEDQLLDGIELEDGPARVLSLSDEGGEGANRWYRLSLQEGRNREVRRMFEALGLTVSRLIRIKYGAIDMPSWLKRGQSKLLDEAETFALLESVGLRSNSPRAQMKRAMKNGGAAVGQAPLGAMRNAREHEQVREGRSGQDALSRNPRNPNNAGGRGRKSKSSGRNKIDPMATSFGFNAGAPRGARGGANKSGAGFGVRPRGKKAAIGVFVGRGDGSGGAMPASAGRRAPTVVQVGYVGKRGPGSERTIQVGGFADTGFESRKSRGEPRGILDGNTTGKPRGNPRGKSRGRGPAGDVNGNVLGATPGAKNRNEGNNRKRGPGVPNNPNGLSGHPSDGNPGQKGKRRRGGRGPKPTGGNTVTDGGNRAPRIPPGAPRDDFEFE